MRDRRAALGAVLGAGLLGEFAYGLLLFPLLQHYLVFDRGLSAAFPGYVLAAYGLARLTLQVPLGGVADATDRRAAVVIGYLAVLAGGLLCWSPGPALIVPAAAALFGAGHALADPLLPVALAEAVQVQRRGRIISAMNLTQVIGLVAGLGGGAFVTDLAPASVGFLTVAAANAGALLLVAGATPLLRERAGTMHRVSVSSMTRALTTERAIDIFAVLFLLALAMNVIMPNIDAYSVQRLHEPLHELIPLLIPAAIVGIAALPLGGWLTDRQGRLLPLLLGAMLASFGFVNLGLTADPARAAIGAAFAAAGLGLTMPASNVALLEVAGPDHRALLLSGMMAVQGLGQAAGPLFGGLMAQAAGAGAAFFLGAAALFLVVPGAVLFASTPHDDEPGQVVGYTPFTRAISRLNIRAHERRAERRAAGAEEADEARLTTNRNG
ncbi:MAG: MFS transporter [Dehalococcoidia bacterium]